MFQPRIFCGIAGFFLFFSLAVGAGFAGMVQAERLPAKSFTDVGADHWANEAVQNMVEHGIIDGYEDGTFQPENSLTREQFAKLLTVVLDKNLDVPQDTTFSDVQPDSWSFPYVETVKDDLTGYTLPFGKPFFEPNKPIKRIDVAVALVKGMGISPDNANGANLVRGTLADADEVSPQLAGYVAAAIQAHLIEGYPDGTFKPANSLDRASAAALLHRLVKSPKMPPLKEITLEEQVPDTSETGAVQISGTTGTDTKLFINDEEVAVYNGAFNVGYRLAKGEGAYDFELRAVKGNGRYKSVKRRMVYTIPSPVLDVKAEENTEKQKMTVTGTVKDVNDSRPSVSINGQSVSINSDGSWSALLNLKEGTNGFNVTATNNSDKQTLVRRTVQLAIKPPELLLSNVPQTMNTAKLTIKGTLKDVNDDAPKLYLNDSRVRVNGGSIELSVDLQIGENTLKFRAENSMGKSLNIEKKVYYEILPPTLTIGDIKETVNSGSITVTASAVDANDSYPDLYINDRYMGMRTFTSTISLNEGENVLVFKAENSHGKSTTQVRKVIYTVLPPVLNVDPIPETSGNKSIIIKASATDPAGGYLAPDIFINGQYAGYGSVSKSYTLAEGENTITIKAVSSGKKTTEVIKKVTYTVPSPQLTVDPLPETTTTPTVTLKASVKDDNDYYPKLYLNGLYMNGDTLAKTVTLQEGENVFEFKALNSAGKTQIIVKKVIYSVEAPAPAAAP